MGPHPCMEQGAQQNPRELKKEEKAVPVQESLGPTLEEVCESYCSAPNKTITEYRRILWNQAPSPWWRSSCRSLRLGPQAARRSHRGDVVMSYVIQSPRGHRSKGIRR